MTAKLNPTINPKVEITIANGQKISAMTKATAKRSIEITAITANIIKLITAIMIKGIPTNINNNTAARKIKGLSMIKVKMSGIKFQTI